MVIEILTPRFYKAFVRKITNMLYICNPAEFPCPPLLELLREIHIQISIIIDIPKQDINRITLILVFTQGELKSSLITFVLRTLHCKCTRNVFKGTYHIDFNNFRSIYLLKYWAALCRL